MPKKPICKLEDMMNIGPALASWLRQAGIETPEMLQEIGAVEAFLRIRPVNNNASNRMALYAIHGAIHGMNCMKLSPEEKEMLEEMLQQEINA